MFGRVEEARRSVQRVERVHDRVRGVLAEDGGLWKAGGRYSAHDRSVQRWVWATLVDTSEVVCERLVRPFHPGEGEALYLDWLERGRFFGIPGRLLPPTRADLHAYLGEAVASGEVHVTDTARELAPAILRPRVPDVPPAGWKVASACTAGLLPAFCREGYRLPFGDAERRVASRSEATMRLVLRRTPRVRRRFPCAHVAARRAGRALAA